MRATTILLVTVLLFGAVACGGADDQSSGDVPAPTPGEEEPARSDDAQTPSDDADPLDGDWDVDELTVDGERIEIPGDRRITVSIDGDRIGGVAACNSYGGTLDSDRGDNGGTFVVGELSWTEMGCEPEVTALEQSFLHALQIVDSYEVADGLHVAAAGAATNFHLVRQPPVPDAELVGTRWVLDTYVTGDAASNMPGMDDAFLEFADDGSLTGSTGCRMLDGEWRLDGNVLQIPTLAAIDDPAAGACSPESDALDRLVVSVVESGVTVEVDGRRLTLTVPGGDGLSFRAS